jgi:hypothetical protein
MERPGSWASAAVEPARGDNSRDLTTRGTRNLAPAASRGQIRCGPSSAMRFPEIEPLECAVPPWGVTGPLQRVYVRLDLVKQARHGDREAFDVLMLDVIGRP